MSDIPSFPYGILWQERQLVWVANLTRQDGLDFLKIVPQAGIRTKTTAFPLAEANDVLTRLRTGQILGAAVLKPWGEPVHDDFIRTAQNSDVSPEISKRSRLSG